MAREFLFLCLLTATRDPFEWRANHREPKHTKLTNIEGTQKVRLKYCQYKQYDRKKQPLLQCIIGTYIIP
jgi:hypothetical protein